MAGVICLAACGGAPRAAPGQAPSTSAVPTTPAPTWATATPSSPTAGADLALACVARIPRDVRIGQTMLVTTTDIPRVQQWLDDGLIAGILANGRLTTTTAGALDRATSGTEYGALLAADEEGGQVQRYVGIAGSIPSAQQQAFTMTTEQVRNMYALHGAALADWGVDIVFAPVADVGHGPGIGSRAYSDDPDVVTDYALAAARGYSDAGLLPVLKHFPGQGDTTGDTHYVLSTGPSIDELRETDLIPFTRITRRADVGVMVGHSTVPGHSDVPSSQSRRTVQGLLIEETGFDGLIVSDALGMAASAAPTQGQALVGFIQAGGHLGIVGPGGSVEGRRALRTALADGTISTDRLNHAAATVLAAKGIDPCSVAGRSAPDVDDSELPSDAPVTNPTEDP